VYAEIKTIDVERKSVVIFGAGESGLITKRTVDQDKDSRKKVICFIDDDPKKRYKTLEGLKIYNTSDDFAQLVEKYKIDELIIAVQEIQKKRREELVELCLKHKIHVKTVPVASDWLNGELSAKQIKDIKIEDLLERDPINLDQDQILDQIKDKVVMITGACGSIGSELVRQIVKYYPKQLILVDQAESPLYELELELQEKYGYATFVPVVGDIRNYDRMEYVFETYQPFIVYHAGAYKHVPLMESNPIEAIHTNVRGTKNLADLAIKFGVDKFIFVSTDKAVNPTNVMGASKRLAEIYIQSVNSFYERKGQHHTKFVTTRFGNVLGSNGSVIPRFRKQLEAGGPITVTHPEIQRYFMTIPEACQLILEAGMIGNGGEIFVFDMGEPVKIIDLARKMIILAGFRVNEDISIQFTGLRPGEKITEELLNNKEKTLPTHHEKIMIGKVREYPFDMVSKEIGDLIQLAWQSAHEVEIVSKMKSIVPEFVSNNSRFEDLDKSPLPKEWKL
jgi:FlaA1/EpsC-like NDP-sugar epimerase